MALLDRTRIALYCLNLSMSPFSCDAGTPFNLFEKSSSLKFADEIDSEASDEKPAVTAALPVTTKQTSSDDEDSWNSEVRLS